MSDKPESLCILPWVHLATTTGGLVKPCCIYKGIIVDERVEDFNESKLKLRENTLSDAWNSKFMQDLRAQHKAGLKPMGCDQCWQHEAAGIRSKRQTDNERFAHLMDRTDDVVLDVNPVYLDMKLGNICNLKCRICFSGSSSSWSSEEIAFYLEDNPGADKKDCIAYKWNKRGRWVEESPEFWEDFENIIGDLEHFDFTGGEPFMIKQHWNLLQKCVDAGVAKNISIHYNTNGTIFPDKHELWKEFKSVEVMCSIDGIGKRFEYQRHPAKWDEVSDNIRKFRELGYVQVSFCHTVDVFNVYYLPEFIEWFESLGMEDHNLWLNILHGAAYHNIKILPTFMKDIIRKRLAGYDKYEIQSVLEYMDSEDWNLREWANFLNRTKRSDAFRGESFEEVFSEFCEEFDGLSN